MLETDVVAVEKQIQEATGDVTGDKDSLSDKVINYIRLQLDSQFIDRQLASVMTALENVRAKTQRKQLYLERLMQPNQPDVAVGLKRLKRIFEIFALGMLVWGVLNLVLADICEHHD